MNHEIIPMPHYIKVFNGRGEPCDALSGPCLCGAWHNVEDIREKLLRDFPMRAEEINLSLDSASQKEK